MAVLSKKALSIEGSINQEGGIQRIVLVKAISRRCGFIIFAKKAMAVLSKKALSIKGSINQEGGIQRVVLVKVISRRCGFNHEGLSGR